MQEYPCKNKSDAHLLWNLVPFSKYPSWCTSRMSPYFDFRWQRKGLCRTSTFTSGSGSFPPQAAASRQKQNQPSTVMSMFYSLTIYLKQEQLLERPLRTHRRPSTWQISSHRSSQVDCGLVVSPRKPRPQRLPLPGRVSQRRKLLCRDFLCPRNGILTRTLWSYHSKIYNNLYILSQLFPTPKHEPVLYYSTGFYQIYCHASRSSTYYKLQNYFSCHFLF